MKYGMFSIYDEKANAYLPPFILPETAMAIRTFGDCVNSDTHQFGQHPADYTLYQIATFDDSDGHPEPTKKLILTGLEVRKPKQEQVPEYEL